MPRQLQPAFYDEVATATSALVAEDCQRRSGARSGSDCRDPTPLTRFSCCLLQNGNRETEAQGCSLDGNSCHSESQIHGLFLFRPRIRSNMEPAKLKNGGGGFGDSARTRSTHGVSHMSCPKLRLFQSRSSIRLSVAQGHVSLPCLTREPDDLTLKGNERRLGFGTGPGTGTSASVAR